MISIVCEQKRGDEERIQGGCMLILTMNDDNWAPCFCTSNTLTFSLSYAFDPEPFNESLHSLNERKEKHFP